MQSKNGFSNRFCDVFFAFLQYLSLIHLMGKRILVWFRNDLRVHDNEVLAEAVAKADEILPVFVFDPRQFEKTAFKTLKTGYNRARFLLESVANLLGTFQKKGGELLLQFGLPEEVIPVLVDKYQINEVYHHREVASEETAVSSALEDALWKQRVNLKHFIGHTLYNKEDLPFPIKDIPDVFTQFKKKTERDAVIKPCVPTPEHMSFVKIDQRMGLPSLADLYGHAVHTDGIQFVRGGETEALHQLHEFLHLGEDIAQQQTAIKKQDIISLFSAWLSMGCLSPRQVYWAMKEAEAVHGLKPFYGQIIIGLLWRDYYRFMFKKHSNRFFQPNGFLKDNNSASLYSNSNFDSWKTANTGNDLVNDCMRELISTGYLSNLGRQLVATYLVQQLQVNWLFGAYFFEETLLDYTPASNWGNWAHIAGVGNDQRLSQSFSFEKLQKQFKAK